ncbi:MAG TPA: TlpA disulfide reductase family protein [Verrucomicrobiae bacterium]
MKRIIFIGQSLLLGMALLTAPSIHAQEKGKAPDKDKTAEADKAWQEFLKESRPPGGPPPEWKGQLPTQEQIDEYHRKNGLQTAKAADLARAFYEKYPDHPNAKLAREKEYKLNEVSVELGNTSREARLQELKTALINSPDLPEEKRLQIRLEQLTREMIGNRELEMPALLEVQEKIARILMKEFPGRSEPDNILLQTFNGAVGEGNVQLARRLASELEGKKLGVASQNIMRAQLKRLNAVGHPFIFMAPGIDGKEINLEHMRGKVVVLDFWASWCGPCMRAIPELKEMYEKYKPQGFEIIGLNRDESMEVLKEVVEKHKIPWLQHFDMGNPEGGWAAKYGVMAFPTVFLIDKKGILREINAVNDLEEKVKKLLAE